MNDIDTRLTRLEDLVLGENGHPGLSERMRRIEAWQMKQDKRTERLEEHAAATESYTHEILGGWRVARWFLIIGIPAITTTLVWLATRLDALAKAAA